MNGVSWTPEEKILLQRLYYTAEWSAICSAIPRHSQGSIQKMAFEMSLRRRRVPRTSCWPFIESLWQIRERSGITRRSLANKMGYCATMMGRWERGDAVPSLRRLVDWCDALNVKLEVMEK
jgi:ribosome-binding protein aMBF1 (putative translation factor)